MITQTNTNGVDFLVNILQAVIQTNGTNLNSNSVVAVPNLIALDAQNALNQSGRVPGGVAYLKPSNAAYIPPGPTGVVAANTNAGVVALSGFEIRPSKLGCVKNGAWIVQCSGTNAVNLSLTNSAVNTTDQVGDTSFGNWNQIIFYNLSGMGIDNSVAGNMTIAPTNTNGANIGTASVNTAGGITLTGAGGAYVAQNWNGTGTAVAANSTNYTVTPTNGGVFAAVLCGS